MNRMSISEEHRTQLIDIDKILSEKNQNLHKKLPKFIIRFLKTLIKQDELNDFIRKNNMYDGINFLRNSFDHFNVHAEIKGEENLPDSGRYIFVSNHPIGSFDGLHLINLLYSKYGKSKAIVNDILMNVKNLQEFFIGVNKHGQTPRERIEELKKLLDSDTPTFFFPAGLVSRKNRGKIKDKEWKKTFIAQARKHKRNIIPIHIEGKLSKKFYRTANLRTFFRIRSNLEMLLLPGEILKLNGKKLIITIGKEIPYTTFYSEKTHQDWAQKVKDHIYYLKENNDAVFKI